ncbi:MAG: nucleotidyl transferase AbiEii/AbiGii toxin family protein, partial [Polaromonas sp.]|nr:nucleotidyl transferase AbiEii/AbiGii toxin family protein [Polaromonas sp.]
SERYARHWHDLAALGRSQYFAGAIADRAVAASVAQHKSFFFIEKDTAGSVIDYLPIVRGHLNIVPTGDARIALADDYENMRADQVMLGDALSFDHLMQACSEVETLANKAAVP